MASKQSERYWALARALDIYEGIQRSMSKDGLRLQPREGMEAAYEEMERLCRTLREMMQELRK